MISIVVPVWRDEVYQRVCKPWASDMVKHYGAQLIEVRGHPSIFESLEVGRQRAEHEIVVYVHDDTRLVEPDDFPEQVIQAFEDHPNAGLIGCYGRQKSFRRLPWWDMTGAWVGHYMNRREGVPVYRYARRGRLLLADGSHREWSGFAPAAFVDGFCLIDKLGVPWDTETFGEHWHGYDVDRCMQAHGMRKDVLVGPWLFMHDNAGHAQYEGGDEQWLADLEVVNDMLRDKWGIE